MGQSLDALKTCDGEQKKIRKQCMDKDDITISCSCLDGKIHSAMASANRGANRLSDDVLVNHELLQAARQGNTPALRAALAKGGWTETRRPLVMKPQKVNRGKGNDGQQELGMTALMFSAQAGSEGCVQMLLDANADVNAFEEDGWTALHFAAKEGNFEVCSKLMAAKADTNATNSEDRTPLQVAETEDEEFAKRMLFAMRRVTAAEGRPHEKQEMVNDFRV
eukprot:gnl/TRDRNA2_/TRDRNA2_190458_c0_seq1.p1 gnl/TRDRNA2_/TRDRNA2_190458_c0~~gnl/TRDRNA2_/TRDRNA2_190458_c0_seq1.p1  ORF type:complete len:222 (-),score=53.37 gnl/TRDRNA2_/TRDRNA2_190458_c0_seq1:95-760(-)